MRQDVNFDDLAAHFQKRIYGSHKGDIRLAILQRDLALCIPSLNTGKLNILDIGAGMAQMGITLAKQGNQVCINDISEKMLALAKAEAAKSDKTLNISWHHGAFQTLAPQPYDVVLCHAILEWLDQPEQLIQKLMHFSHAQTVVSLMFYNFDALVLHNLIRGNFKKINNNDFSGMKGGLTPPNPLRLDWVGQRLAAAGFEIIYKSGVRVFSDYVGVKRGGNETPTEVIEMELRFSNQEPYLRLGRYIHVICQPITANCW